MKQSGEYVLDDIILTQCACGIVKDFNGDYITQEKAEARYKGKNIVYSHGALSLECLKKYYGFVPKGYELMRISCEGEDGKK